MSAVLQQQETDRFWIKSYRPGVPAMIDDELGRTKSLIELFDHYVTAYAERDAVVSIGTAWTYRKLAEKSRNFAAWLQGQGVKKGDRVAIMMPNCLQYPVCVFGTLMTGAVVVNVNPLYTARELHHQLADSGAVILVVVENFAKVAENGIAGTDVKQVLLTGVGDLLGGLKAIGINFMLRHVQKAVPPHNLQAKRLTTALREGAGAKFQANSTRP